mmetsp:Transcript_13754/g.35313  ORF Transcript_13754/g.35313 Transcript_13754/m.35313 type:complete len:129 (+) Transcript_13754:60-446(+)
MGRAVAATLLVAIVAHASAARVALRPPTALADVGRSKASLEQLIRHEEAAEPGFSAENCQSMFEQKLKLGGPVTPDKYVTGCNEVCAQIRAIKDYWKSGDMAEYACEHASTFGCVWDGLGGPKANIGC